MTTAMAGIDPKKLRDTWSVVSLLFVYALMRTRYSSDFSVLSYTQIFILSLLNTQSCITISKS